MRSLHIENLDGQTPGLRHMLLLDTYFKKIFSKARAEKMVITAEGSKSKKGCKFGHMHGMWGMDVQPMSLIYDLWYKTSYLTTCEYEYIVTPPRKIYPWS